MDNDTQADSDGAEPPSRGRRTRVGSGGPNEPKYIVLAGDLTVKELAEKANCLEAEIIKRLMLKGFMRTVNQIVELALAREVAKDMGFTVLRTGRMR